MNSEPIVRLGLMVRGYDEALARFQKAAETWDHSATYLPLFEMLSWATAIDERCQRDWTPDGELNRPGKDWEKRLTGVETLKGVRYVRNRVQHHWAEAFELQPVRSYPREYPMEYKAWLWKAADDLPVPPRRHQNRRLRGFYEDHLARNPVEPTLLALSNTFEQVLGLLETGSSLE